MYYVGGAGTLNRVDAKLTAVLKKARRAGARTFVDVVSPYRQSWDFLKRALPWTDFFHCNSDEAADLTGERDPRRALNKILCLGATYVFLTMGDKGGLAAGTAPGRLTIDDWKNILVYASACGAACCSGVGTTAAVSAERASRLVRLHGRAVASGITVSVT